MKIVTGIILLTFMVFLIKCTESRRTGIRNHLLVPSHVRQIVFRNRSPIFIELPDGTVIGGLIRQQEQYQFPAWVREEHHGAFRIFLQRPNNIGYIATSIHHLRNRHNNIGTMQASIEISEGNLSHANLHLIGNELPPDTRARVYLGMPNGSTFTGYFV